MNLFCVFKTRNKNFYFKCSVTTYGKLSSVVYFKGYLMFQLNIGSPYKYNNCRLLNQYIL